MMDELDVRKRYLFTKRHYEFVAAHLADMREREMYTPDVWLTQVMHMAAIFKKDNPRFVIVRFMQACGLTRGAANRALEGHNEHLT
jgi:hypothetical protein